MATNVKLSNVIGAPFSDYVLLQLYIRAARNSTLNRSNEEVLFLANKSAWARLVSSVNIYLPPGPGEKDLSTFYSQYNPEDPAYFSNYTSADSLAKNWILEAGTSMQKGNGIDLRSGIGPDGAYGLGGTQELGYRPMPGLTSVQIETTGRLGSLREATVSFKAWNMNQLNVIEALYFRLGYTMLLEWGHTQYYDNVGNVGVFHPNDIYGIDDPFKESQRKEVIQQAIALKARNTFGNYDGMLGMVSNFNWSMNQDGGFDCTVKLVGLGAVMDSMRINQAYKLPDGLLQQYNLNRAALDRQIATDAFKKQLIEFNKLYPPSTGGTGTTVNTVNPPTPKYFGGPDGILDLSKRYGGDNLNQAQFIAANGIKQASTVKSVQNLEASDAYSLYAPFTNENTVPGAAAYVLANYRGAYLNLTKGYQRAVTGDTLVLDWQVINAAIEVGTVNDKYLNNVFQDGTVQEAIDKGSKGDASYPAVDGKQRITQLYDIGSRYYKETNAGSQGPNLFSGPPIRSLGAPYKNTGEDIGVSFNAATPDIELKAKSQGKTWNPWFKLETVITKTGINSSFVPTRQQVNALLDSIVANPANYNLLITKIDKDQIQGYFIGYIRVDLNGTGDKTAIATNNKDDATGKRVGDGTQRDVKVLFSFTTNNPGFFTEVISKKPTAEVKAQEPKPPTLEDFLNQNNQATNQQTDSANGFSSALQAMLVAVQMKAKVALGQQNKKYLKLSILEDTNKFFQDGIMNGVLDKANTPVNLPESELSPGKFNLVQYASKGFNSDLMVNPTLYNKILSVDFETLCSVVAIAYKQAGDDSYVAQFAPTYIPFGYLLAFLNNMCLFYDSPQRTVSTNNNSKEGTPKRPYVYIDFNPDTNLCLTTPQQFSIDPLTCIVPLQANNAQYASIFPVDIAKSLAGELIVQPNGDFNQVSVLLRDAKLNFQATSNSNQGKIMNILLNIDYLLDLIQNFAGSDPEHAVKLEPFLNQIVTDVNKALGNINSLRVAYRDESNVIQILDDQWVPSVAGQASVLSATEYSAKLQKVDEQKLAGLLPIAGNPAELPVAGNISLARQFQIRSVMSTKLASMIAISAQAATGSINAKDHSAFSTLNQNFQDRYKPYIQDASNGDAGANSNSNAKAATEGNDFKAAKLFNDHVKNVYYDLNITPDNIKLAKNYYIERMSKIKSEDTSISAAPFIPAEVEMTLDGISGIIMGNAFTIPQDRLPISLRGANGISKVAFIVTGLSHTIQNNEWLTKIKGQMIKLRDNVQTIKASSIEGTLKDALEQRSSSSSSGTGGTILTVGTGGTVPTGGKGPLGQCKYGKGCQRGYGTAYKKTALYNDPEFRAGVEKLNKEFNIADPEALYKIMYAECRLNPADVTPVNGRPFAYGLLQWTADNVGTVVPSLEEVRRTSGVGQLKFVRNYLKSWRYLTKTFDVYSLYGVTFFPRAVPHLTQSNWIIQSPKLSAYIVSYQNPSIACQSGKLPGEPLTIADFRKYVDCIYNN
jgi:hypothetical protein